MESSNIQQISVSELFKQMSNGFTGVVLNVLPAEQFEKNHISGSINLCVYETSFISEFIRRFSDWSKMIICYGYDDDTHDAVSAAEKLVMNGYENVCVLEGGIVAWDKAGLSLSGSDGELSETDEFVNVSEGAYNVDPVRSSLVWIGRNAQTEHQGTVPVKTGQINICSDGVTGKVTVDMTQIKNTNLEDPNLNRLLVEHLLSEDFFFVKWFREAIFDIESVTLNRTVLSAPNAIVNGIFEMRGVRKPMSFTATLSNTSQEDTLTVNTHIFVDRTEWGAIYGSSRFFKFLGKHLVYDGVTIELRLVLSRIVQ